MPVAKGRQARLPGNLDHIRLEPDVLQRREYRPTAAKKRGRFPETSPTNYKDLSSSFRRIHSISVKRAKIYSDPRMYFVINFSDVLSWKPVQDTVRGLEVSVVEVIDERTVKVSLKKDRYQSFLYNLGKNCKYVKGLHETVLSQKLEQPLIEELRNKPDQSGWFTFELVSLSGIEDAEAIQKSIVRYVTSNNLGEIARSYLSERLLILTGVMKYRAVEEIASEIEAVSRVFTMPMIKLVKDESWTPSLGPAIPLTAPPGEEGEVLPSVCAIDSGINKGHRLLRDFIDDTFDYSTGNQGPCNDVDGHGSLVSGLAVYGEDLKRVSSPLAKVIMVKNFEAGDAIERNVLKVIFETLTNYRYSSMVFNLSFAADGPNPSLTRALDEIIFRDNAIVVASAGNVELPVIMGHINSGLGYPDYIGLHKIFFPGDCRNGITVGSYAGHDSNLVKQGWPSPFTRSSPSVDFVKPEVMSCGGNVRAHYLGERIESLSTSGLGVWSTSKDDDGVLENIGTSFCSPVIANLAASIVATYPSISTFLTKAIILSSCEYPRDLTGSAPDLNLEGFGQPNRVNAVYSQSWRACYLLEGEFKAEDADKYHRYRFLFPDDADELDVTVVCGKLETAFEEEKADYVRLRFTRPGPKRGTPLRTETSLGQSKCFCTYRARSRIQRGSKGAWTVDVIPHFFSWMSKQWLRYGCVITVSSSRGAQVYKPIKSWVGRKEEVVEPVQVVEVKPALVSVGTG